MHYTLSIIRTLRHLKVLKRSIGRFVFKIFNDFEVDFYYHNARPVIFPLSQIFTSTFGLLLSNNHCISSNRDQTSIIHLPRSLPILKRSFHCHSCSLVFPIHQRTGSFTSTHSSSARILANGLLQSPTLLIQATGRVTVTSRRPQTFPTDNIYRSRIGDGYHTPASSVHLSPSFSSEMDAWCFLPANGERVSSMCAGQESKREVRDRRSVG